MPIRNRAVLVALVAVAAASTPAMSQQRGTMEFGGFASAASFDNSLTLDSGFGAGGRIGMFVIPRLSIEFEQSWMSASRPLGLKDVNVGIIGGRVVGVAYEAKPFSFIVGAGAGISTETNFLHAVRRRRARRRQVRGEPAGRGARRRRLGLAVGSGLEVVQERAHRGQLLPKSIATEIH